MELKSKIRFRSLLFFDLELEGDPMKKFIKWLLERPFIKGFMRFYMASESDITSIAVAYYLLISILPLLLIAANILPYFKIRPTQILLTLREVLPASMYRIVLQVISSVLTKPSTGLASLSFLHYGSPLNALPTCKGPLIRVMEWRRKGGLSGPGFLVS